MNNTYLLLVDTDEIPAMLYTLKILVDRSILIR